MVGTKKRTICNNNMLRQYLKWKKNIRNNLKHKNACMKQR